ncbi:MAG: hypothetical protein ACF8NJ_07290 [Phycisphaerales bacterium JB038]
MTAFQPTEDDTTRRLATIDAEPDSVRQVALLTELAAELDPLSDSAFGAISRRLSELGREHEVWRLGIRRRLDHGEWSQSLIAEVLERGHSAEQSRLLDDPRIDRQTLEQFAQSARRPARNRAAQLLQSRRFRTDD